MRRFFLTFLASASVVLGQNTGTWSTDYTEDTSPDLTSILTWQFDPGGGLTQYYGTIGDLFQGAAGAPGILQLTTEETTVVDGDILGRINFFAPDEADGDDGDAQLLAASIWAEADNTFSDTVNETSIVFGLARSETAAEMARFYKNAQGGLAIAANGDGFPTLSLQSGVSGVDYGVMPENMRFGFSSSANANYTLQDTFLTRVNVNEMALGESSQTDPSVLHLFDGGADNEPGQVALYDDAGNRYSLWVSTAGDIRFVSGATTDDDTDGTALNAAASFDATAVDNPTWSDNTQASLSVTFDTSSTNDVNIDISDDLLTVDVGDVVIDQDLTVTGDINASQVAHSDDAITLGAAATTFATASDFQTITGDGGGNTIATITGGVTGQVLTLLFVDANVTITDTAAATADTINLSAAFTSTADDTMQLVYNGTKWYEVSRSTN